MDYRIFSTLIIFAFLTSCAGKGDKNKDATVYNKQTALELYEIEVPDYMKTTTGLNQDASMQYQNIYKETYLAIIEEPKKDFKDVFEELGDYDNSKSMSENYCTIQMQYFTEGMEIISIENPKSVTINNLEAQQLDLIAKVEGVSNNIYYLMTFVEGKDTVYMIMQWTLDVNEKNYKNTFSYMASTFKEL